jgi:Starch-binding associating with outer membrane
MKKFIYTFIALIGLIVAGCNDFLNINTNPNAPSVTVPDLVLSGALVESARGLSQDMNAYSMYWAGYWAASGTYSASGDVRRNFILTNNSFAGVWSNLYLNASNYNFVEKSAKSIKGHDNYVAICKVMKAYVFQILVDNYGNVPYTDALKGFVQLSPSYDDAQTIYTSLSAQLDSAVALIQNASSDAAPVPKTTDVMFSGDMTKWVKLANTLNLKLLLRQSEVTTQASFITAEIAKIVANGGGFLGAGQDALINPGYTQATGLQNPFWESNGLGVGNDIGNRDYNRTSAYSLAFFQVNNDPRVNYVFRTPDSPPGTNKGVKPYFSIPFGAPPDAQYATGVTSGFGIGVMPGPSAPVVFLSASESLFLQAEASQRGWIAGSTQTLYQTGISESFRLLGASGAATYYGQAIANVGWASSSANLLEAIIVQKWAAMCSIDGMEAWSDVRRLGFPDDLPQSGEPSKINPTPPVRLLYPQSEYNTNNGSVSKQPVLGNNREQFDHKIFWDVN